MEAKSEAATVKPCASSVSHALKPCEVYGDPDALVCIRVGNGGAGPTGILRALAEDYLARTNRQERIEWYQTISRYTLEALKTGQTDISLSYEPAMEAQAVSEGWAIGLRRAFNNHFVLVGPVSNPAGLNPQDTPASAFAKIVQFGSKSSRPTFLSRNDGSGTNHKEQGLFRANNAVPWEKFVPWYISEQVFPVDALVLADAGNLYHLTDRGTFLTARMQLKNTQVYVQGFPILLNPCSLMLRPNSSESAHLFAAYINGLEGQTLIKYFGRNKFGLSTYTPAQQEQFLPENNLPSPLDSQSVNTTA